MATTPSLDWAASLGATPLTGARSIRHSGASAGVVDFSTLADLIKNKGKGVIDPGTYTFELLLGTQAGYGTQAAGATTGTLLDMTSIDFGGITREQVDLTTYDAANRYRIKKAGRVDMGNVTIGWFLNLGTGDPSNHGEAIDRLSSATTAENWTFTLAGGTTIVVPGIITGSTYVEAQGSSGVTGQLVVESTGAWTGTFPTTFYALCVADPSVTETLTITGSDGSTIEQDGFICGWKPSVSDVDQAVVQEVTICLSGPPTITPAT